MKEKKRIQTLLKLKPSACEGLCKENRKQATNWEKVLANHISDTRLVSKIHKNNILNYII